MCAVKRSGGRRQVQASERDTAMEVSGAKRADGAVKHDGMQRRSAAEDSGLARAIGCGCVDGSSRTCDEGAGAVGFGSDACHANEGEAAGCEGDIPFEALRSHAESGDEGGWQAKEAGHEAEGLHGEGDSSGEEGFRSDPLALSPQELGRRGEEAACELLKRKDYVILERNWSCPAGEADIIAMDDDCLVFVEVKTRAGVECGLPEDAVTPRKRAKYERIAGFFLSDYDGPDSRVRFDVIGILALSGNRALARHVVNAFGVGD